MSLQLTVYLVVTAALSGVLGAENLRVIDLTHVHGPNTVFWPGNPKYNFTIQSRGLQEGGFWFENNNFQTAEHGGTHADAPAHFGKGHNRLAQIPMSNLFGPGVVINVTEKAAIDSDYQATISDLSEWESKYGQIPNGAVVIMNSGWHRKYPNKTLVFGSEFVENSKTFHFPSWHEDAVDWLVKNRNIHVLGVDTPSIDYAQSTKYSVHRIIASRNITGAENVANLDAVPECGCIFYVAAIKLYDGSGGPARVFATCADDSLIYFSITLFISVALNALMIAVYVYNAH